MTLGPLYMNDCGVVTPLGAGKATTTKALFAGQSGITTTRNLIDGNAVPVGAVKVELPQPPDSLRDLDCRNNRLMQLALMEIEPTVQKAIEKYGRDRVAVVMGTSTAGIEAGEKAYTLCKSEGALPADFHYKQQELSNLPAFVSRYFNVSGPSYTIATACSSSAKVFACARRIIKAGFADAVIVGGADTLCQMTVNGFNSLQLLSPKPCNPFSANRNGITIGEGAAAFLVSRDYGPVELSGVGETSDAHHLTAPDPTGKGAHDAMKAALADAKLSPVDIDYINLHGTASIFNDAMEAAAIYDLFGSSVLCSSTKGMTGHMLGGTGGCEAAFMWLALNSDYNKTILPPHLWDGVPDPALPALSFVNKDTCLPDKARPAMLSNSFGFGGSNVSLIFARASYE